MRVVSAVVHCTLPTPSFAAHRQPSPPTPVKQKNTPSTAGATGNEVNDESDSTKKGVGATGYGDNNNNGSGTTGYEVDDYGEGATGNDDYDNDGGNDGDGTKRCNNQIKATAAAGGNNSHRRSIPM